MYLYESSINEITPDIFKRMYGKSYKENCTIALSDLRYVCILHYDFDCNVRNGELVVHKAIAQKIVCIFEELYAIRYPIEKICLVDEYDAVDIASMTDNNSSAFNYRTIEGTDKLSNHSMGLAIDINPLYNPYVRFFNGIPSVLPELGIKYANRELNCPYYIKKNDACYRIFCKYGFTWGGDWEHAKDYQHFEYAL